MKSSADKGQTLTAPPAPYKTAKAGNVVKAEPVLREDGIFYGDKGLIVHKSGKLTLMAGDKLGEFFTYFSTSNSGWIATNFQGFQDEKMERNLKDREFVYTAVFPLAKKGTENMPYGKYQQKVKVTEDNKINISYEYSVPEGLEKNIRDTRMMFCMPFGVGAAKKCEINGKTYEFSAKAGVSRKEVHNPTAKKFVFNPGNPETEFVLEMISDIGFCVQEEKETIDLWFPNRVEKLSFTLDLSTVPETALVNSNDFQAGIDFWKCDRLHVPDYGKCRNLAQNSSFEAGLRYYELYRVWVSPGFKNWSKPVFSVDETVAKFGNSSLMINAFKGNETGYLSTFAIPVVEGKKYTVSFYAKGNKKGLWINTRIVTGIWLEFPKSPGCHAPTNDWTRISFTITAPNNLLEFLIRADYYGDKNDPSGEGTAWIDGLQIEEGEQATDYVEKPLSSILLTSNPDNFLSVEDKKVDARLKITTPANMAGKVTCGIEDFFYRKIWEQGFDFKTDAKGVAVVNLPIENLLGRGIYVVRADYELSNGYKNTDYYRISRMEFLKNTHKNKDIFATNAGWTGHLRFRDLLKRLRDVGFGSVNYGPGDLSKAYFDGIAEYGISFNDEGMLQRGNITVNGKRLS